MEGFMRLFALAGLLCGALAFVNPAEAQAPWSGTAGGGLLGVQEATVAAPRHGACGLMWDNYDRDPLGLDITDVRMSCRMGIVGRLEAFGSYDVARAVVVPGNPPVPPPPLDIIVAGGEIPWTPYRVMYLPLPYIADDSSSVVDRIGGQLSLGLKALVLRPRRFRPAIALSVQVTETASQSPDSLRRGAGDAATNLGAHASATWRLNSRFEPSLNLGYTRLGFMRYRDRFLTSEGSLLPQAERPNLLHLGAGVRFRASHRFHLIGQVMGWRPVGPHTPTLEYSGASDAMLGFQLRQGRFTLTSGFRQHLGPSSSDIRKRTGPLGDAVVLTNVAPSERARYLNALGVELPAFRQNVGILVLGASENIPLPDGAVHIPKTFSTNTHGNTGAIISLSYSF